MISAGRIGLRLFQGLALILALGLSLVIIITGWIMYRYDIRVLGVQTGSMTPAITVGDGLISRPVRFEELLVGEVVNYKSSTGSTVSHRILSLDKLNRRLIAKGDNNTEPDGLIAGSQVISQPIAVVPYAGKIISLLQQPAVVIGMVYLPATIILAREIIRLNDAKRRIYRLNSI